MTAPSYPYTEGEFGHLIEHDNIHTTQANHESRLAALEAGGGGGTGGAVQSVNGKTGAVTLSASDVGAPSTDDSRLSNARTPTAHASTHATGGSDAISATAIWAVPVILYNTATSAYPARSTVTTDTTRPVQWWGPTAPAIGSGFAVDNLDAYLNTPAVA